ncbi:MAG: OB-fold domain-containing protein [Chloroflexi bacterium]|nr:OB-fold domain-containing protein [Chloroflexota bacterium]
MELPRHWRLRAARYRLLGARHRSTGEVVFPREPRHAADAWDDLPLSGAAELYSFSVVRQPATDDDAPPALLALVRLAEGPLITARITDCRADELTIGMPLEMVTRALRALGPDGLIVYGYAFRPLVWPA